MQLRFHADPHTGLAHILNHGVEEREVREVLLRPHEDRAGKDGSRLAVGQTLAGRYLKVIYVPDGDGWGLFVVTAYDLGNKALAAYRRRSRRRGKAR